MFFTVYISCFIILGIEHLLSAYGYLNKRRNIQKLIHSFSLIQRNHKPSILQCHSPQAICPSAANITQDEEYGPTLMSHNVSFAV